MREGCDTISPKMNGYYANTTTTYRLSAGMSSSAGYLKIPLNAVPHLQYFQANLLSNRLQDDVVDEAHGDLATAETKLLASLRVLSGLHLDSGAQNGALLLVNHIDFLKGIRVRQRDVVHIEQGPILRRQLLLLPNLVVCQIMSRPEDVVPLPLATSVLLLRLPQRLRENRRDVAAAGAEVDVPRAHGQAIHLALGGADDDVGGDVEVADHAADDDGLLDVLLAEVDAVGLDDVEQLGAHGGDAAEEDGSRRALELVGQRRDGHEAAVAVDVRGRWQRRVHDLGRRREDGLDAAARRGGRQLVVQRAQLLEVSVPRLRVRVEVLVDAELGGVDVDGDVDVVRLLGGLAHEREMAVVQCAHGGDHADAPLGQHLLAAVGAQRLDLAEDAERRILGHCGAERTNGGEGVSRCGDAQRRADEGAQHFGGVGRD